MKKYELSKLYGISKFSILPAFCQ